MFLISLYLTLPHDVLLQCLTREGLCKPSLFNISLNAVIKSTLNRHKLLYRMSFPFAEFMCRCIVWFRWIKRKSKVKVFQLWFSVSMSNRLPSVWISRRKCRCLCESLVLIEEKFGNTFRYRIGKYGQFGFTNNYLKKYFHTFF